MDADYTFYRPGAIGDVLLISSLLPAFLRKHGSETRVAIAVSAPLNELMGQFLVERGFCCVLDASHGWFGKMIPLFGYPTRERMQYHPSLPEGNHPHEPMKKHLLEYFSEELGIEPYFDSFFMKRPPKCVAGDYATVHVKSGWSMYKEWPAENWNQVCWNLKRAGIKVVQIGGEDDPKLPEASGHIDVSLAPKPRQARFEMNLALMAHAKMHMGIDSWTNHATNIQWLDKETGIIARTPAIILWGSSQPSALGYKHNVNISANIRCQPCWKENPKISNYPLGRCENPPNQTYEAPKHACMAEIDTKHVYDAAIQLWGAK